MPNAGDLYRKALGKGRDCVAGSKLLAEIRRKRGSEKKRAA